MPADALHGNRSHLAAENALPTETYRGRECQMSRWRTWHGRNEASLPRLVREADRRWRNRDAADHAPGQGAPGRTLRRGERSSHPPRVADAAGRSAEATEPPEAASVRGLHLADYPAFLPEWAWDVNADLDPVRLTAGSHEAPSA